MHQRLFSKPRPCIRLCRRRSGYNAGPNPGLSRQGVRARRDLSHAEEFVLQQGAVYPLGALRDTVRHRDGQLKHRVIVCTIPSERLVQGNVVRASGRSIAARAIAYEALGPHPVDVLHCGRRFQVQHGADIGGAVVLRLGAIGDSEIVRQGFRGQKQGDVVEESRRVGGLRGWRPG